MAVNILSGFTKNVKTWGKKSRRLMSQKSKNYFVENNRKFSVAFKRNECYNTNNAKK